MKFNDWIKWYKIGERKGLAHPELPGASLLIGWFMIFVVFIRIFEFISHTLIRWAFYISAFGICFIYIFTFLWGR